MFFCITWLLITVVCLLSTNRFCFQVILTCFSNCLLYLVTSILFSSVSLTESHYFLSVFLKYHSLSASPAELICIAFQIFPLFFKFIYLYALNWFLIELNLFYFADPLTFQVIYWSTGYSLLTCLDHPFGFLAELHYAFFKVSVLSCYL